MHIWLDERRDETRADGEKGRWLDRSGSSDFDRACIRAFTATAAACMEASSAPPALLLHPACTCMRDLPAGAGRTATDVSRAAADRQ
jgi:hypothetical protein